ERAQIARWLDPNRGQLKHICAERTQLAAECARLFSRPRNDDPFSRKRPLLVPIQTLSQGNHFAKHRDGRRFETVIDSAFGDILKRTRKRFLTARRSPTNERHG